MYINYKLFGYFGEIQYFCKEFLKTPNGMRTSLWHRMIISTVLIMAPVLLFAQVTVCKDTVVHHRLQKAMWEACGQDDPKVLYDACKAFQAHASSDGDLDSYYNAWICGIVYNLDRMNIRDAYHITKSMTDDLLEGKGGKDEQFLAPNMLGQVYNTCGNVEGAIIEFKKAVELIKGTKYEETGLSTLYLGMAHIYINGKLDNAFHWIDEDIKEVERHPDLPSYHRNMADAYAFKAMLYFKRFQKEQFWECRRLAISHEEQNTTGGSGSFLPYMDICQMVLEGRFDEALHATDELSNLRDRYIMKCDILRYRGEPVEAYKTLRDLMHIRDSITGLTIAENIANMDEEMRLIKSEQAATQRANIVLTIAFILAVLLIVALLMNGVNRRRYQKELESKNRELEEANGQVTAADKMKTEFIRSVSHEIRTPLNIINGFTQVLTDTGNSFEPEERQQIAGTISENTRQITSLVNKMLVLANDNSKNLLKEVEGTDGIALCHRAIQAMPPVDPTRIQVIFEDRTKDGDGRLCTNEDSLLQMLCNLLENSVKFTEAGFIRLTLSRDDSFYHFTVEDSGCGIQKDKIDHVFERFTKGDEFKEGLGIGLAYCHETAQKLGGNLMLDHTSEKGTSFTLSLPIKSLKT